MSLEEIVGPCVPLSEACVGGGDGVWVGVGVGVFLRVCVRLCPCSCLCPCLCLCMFMRSVLFFSSGVSASALCSSVLLVHLREHEKRLIEQEQHQCDNYNDYVIATNAIIILSYDLNAMMASNVIV